MQKSLKVLLCTGVVSGLVLGSAITSFAGTWKQGTAPNEKSWWYDFDNGTCAQSGWQWIDGNNDGVAESYYFDSNGWMLSNTTTPDGYTVNANGAWTENGTTKTQTVQTEQSTQAGNQESTASESYLTGQYKEDGLWYEKQDVTDYGETSYTVASFRRWMKWASQKMETVGYTEDFWDTQATIDCWAAEDATGEGAAWKGVFDKYQIPTMLFDGNIGKTVTFRSQPGTKDASHEIWNALIFSMWMQSDGMSTVVDANGSSDWTDAEQFLTFHEDGSITYTITSKWQG